MFATKRDAQRWLDQVTAALVTGTYVDPQLQRVTFAGFYASWSRRQAWVPGTVRAMDLATADVPFRHIPLGTIRTSHVEHWVCGMIDRPLAPGTIRTRFNNVRSVFRAAMRDRLLAVDPTAGVTLPRTRRAEAAMRLPEPLEVGRLLAVADPQFRPFVGLCAFAGLRLGEAAALRVGDIDFLRKRLALRRQVQRMRGGEADIRLPKHGSERTVWLPDDLVAMLARHVEQHRPGDDPQRWMFPGERDQPWHQNTVGYWWRKTRAAAGADDIRLHDMRHFYASGLIAVGCDVVTVQRALGHHSATVTLSTYGHLWPTAEDRTRAAAASLMTSATAAEAPVRPQRARSDA